MFLALIPIAFLLHYFIFKPLTDDRRLAGLLAALLLGVYVAVVTEILSVFHAVTRMGIAVAWAEICVAAAIALWRIKLRQAGGTTNDAAAAENGANAEHGTEAKVLSGGVGLLSAIVAITAIAGAPNVWDATEYHLARVSMWMGSKI